MGSWCENFTYGGVTLKASQLNSRVGASSCARMYGQGPPAAGMSGAGTNIAFMGCISIPLCMRIGILPPTGSTRSRVVSNPLLSTISMTDSVGGRLTRLTEKL